MKDNENKELEQLVEFLMSHDTLESPSKEFNSSVLAKLNPEPKMVHAKYKPLISRKILIFAAVFCLLLMSTPFFIGYDSDESWFSLFDTISMPSLKLSFIPKVTLSNIILYAIMFFMAMFGVQIAAIKSRFEKSISL